MRVLLFLSLWCCWNTAMIAQNKIEQALDELAESEHLRHGSLSLTAIDVATGSVVAAYQPQLSLIPASSIKVITTATALELLGADFRFETQLQYDGTIRDGVLDGNLYIKGYGDPTLGSDQLDEAVGLEQLLEEWGSAIKSAGIHQINGQIVGDASFFEGTITNDTWQWYDLGNYYATGAWGLNVHENFYYLSFKQAARLGDTPTVVAVRPAIPQLKFINELKSAGKSTGDNAYIYGAPYSDQRVIRGTIPVGSGRFTIKGAMPDPAYLLAYSLRQHLVQTHLPSLQAATTLTRLPSKKTDSRKTIHTHYSPPLSVLAKRANHKSVNLYCEAMLKRLGVIDASATTENGIETVQTHWESKGVDLNGFFLADGCGLSPRTNVTSYQLAQILKAAHSNSAFYRSLPIAGQSGTVRNFLKNTALSGKMRVKSGTLERVRSYSGYLKTADGRELAVSIMVNNYTGSSSMMRRKMEQILLLLC